MADGFLHQIAPAFVELATAAVIYAAGVLTAQLQGLRSKVHAPIESTHGHDVSIDHLLTQALTVTGAKRCYLSQFHNGDYFDAGSPIQKKSRTHEQVAEGWSYEAEQFKSVLVSTIPDEIAIVLEPGPSFRHVDDLPDGKFKWLCRRGGVHSIARCSVSINGKVVGFVGADFDTGERPDRIDTLCETAERIGLELAANERARLRLRS